MQSKPKLTKSHAFIDGVLVGLAVNALVHDDLAKLWLRSIKEAHPDLHDWAAQRWAEHSANLLEDASFTVSLIENTP